MNFKQKPKSTIMDIRQIAGALREINKNKQQLKLSARACTKLEWLLFFAENPYSVSETCRKFNISRSTLYRTAKQFDPENPYSLENGSHRPKKLRVSSISDETAKLILHYRQTQPHLGSRHIADLLKSEHETHVSPSAIARLIKRNNWFFGSTLMHLHKQLLIQPNSESGIRDWVKNEIQEAAVEIPVEPTVENTAHCSLPTDHSPAPHCFFCKWWSILRLPLTRALIVTSLVANIAFIGLMIYVATLERQASQESMHAAAPLIQTDFGSSLDSPSQ